MAGHPALYVGPVVRAMPPNQTVAFRLQRADAGNNSGEGPRPEARL